MAKLRHIALLVAVLSGSSARSDGVRQLTLAASAASRIPELSVQETRKLYLGVPVEKNGTTIKPLLNESDPLLYEVFLQRVTFMSAEAYERQVRAIVFRLGGQRPEIFTDRQGLVESLLRQPNAVTFVWSNDLEHEQRLKAISTLWTGAIN
jgi:hypothetical protein